MTGRTLREQIVAQFPQAAEGLAEVIELWGDVEAGPAVYSYVSVGFFHPVFHTAVMAADLPTVERCYRFVEDLLDSPVEDVVDATCIRVLPWMLGPRWIGLTRRFAGPLASWHLEVEYGYRPQQ